MLFPSYVDVCPNSIPGLFTPVASVTASCNHTELSFVLLVLWMNGNSDKDGQFCYGSVAEDAKPDWSVRRVNVRGRGQLPGCAARQVVDLTWILVRSSLLICSGITHLLNCKNHIITLFPLCLVACPPDPSTLQPSFCAPALLMNHSLLL